MIMPRSHNTKTITLDWHGEPITLHVSVIGDSAGQWMKQDLRAEEAEGGLTVYVAGPTPDCNIIFRQSFEVDRGDVK